MASIGRKIAKFIGNVDTSGNVVSNGISSSVEFGGLETYDSLALLPYTGNSPGDLAFVNSNNRLYIHQGEGWYNVALINRSTSITSVQDSDAGTTPFTLSSEGAVTRITITATDSDDTLITYTATADSDFNGLATITNTENVFTITPFSQDSATTTSGTITFKASDGINTSSSDVQTFTLVFASSWETSTRTAVFPNTSIGGFDGNEYFGNGLAFSPDGTKMAVGVYGWTANQGAVQIFEVDSSGDSATYISNIPGISSAYQAGYDVAFADDNHLVIGSPASGSYGAIYIYKTTDDWATSTQIHTRGGSSTSTQFGQTIIYDIGSDLLWSSNGTRRPNNERFWKYDFSADPVEISWNTLNTQDGSVGILTGGGGSTRSGVDFDRDRVAIGERLYDYTAVNRTGTNITNVGGVELAELNSARTSFSVNRTFIGHPGPTNANSRFGQAVALLDDMLIVGATGDKDSANGLITNVGAVYCYTTDDSGSTWDLNQRIVDSDTIATNRYYGQQLNLIKTQQDKYLLAITGTTYMGVQIWVSENKTTWTKEGAVYPTPFSGTSSNAVFNNHGTMLGVGNRIADSAGTNYGRVDIFVAQ